MTATFHQFGWALVIDAGVHCRYGEKSSRAALLRIKHRLQTLPLATHALSDSCLSFVIPHRTPTHPRSGSQTKLGLCDADWLALRLTFLLANMAEQQDEDTEPQTSFPPATPRLSELELDRAFDEEQEGPQLPLVRNFSYSEDPANTGRSHIDAQFDAELASLDSQTSTPIQPFFPCLPSFISSAGYYTVEYAGDEAAYDMTATSPARGGVSPSSSPRLPSPPPFTEVQIGPKSPSVGDANQNQLGDAARIDNGSTRRIRPGTKAADMDKGPPLVPLNEVCISHNYV